MAYTVYGLQALANGLISQVKVVKVFATSTLIDTFTWDGTNTILVAGTSFGTLKKNDAVAIVLDVPAGTTINKIQLENGEASNNIMATVDIPPLSYTNAGTYTINNIPVTIANV